MTLAESEAARRRRRQALKAADRTEARLFENVLQIRAIEERDRTATSRMKAERSRQARRSASQSIMPASASSAHPTVPPPSVIITPPAVIEPFADVEDL